MKIALPKVGLSNIILLTMKIWSVAGKNSVSNLVYSRNLEIMPLQHMRTWNFFISSHYKREEDYFVWTCYSSMKYISIAISQCFWNIYLTFCCSKWICNSINQVSFVLYHTILWNKSAVYLCYLISHTFCQQLTEEGSIFIDMPF